MQKNSFLLYLLTGGVLGGILVGMILLLRLMRPGTPSQSANFPRAKGPADATVQLIEYSDFQCPACRTAQSTLAELLNHYQEKVRLVYQHFPLEGHRWSALAHHAAECAAEQSQFWVYHDRLYAEQPNWSMASEPPVESLMRYAKEASLDLNRFSHCLADPKVDGKIQGEKLAGIGLGVRSTPTFFVNGKLVVGTKSLQEEIERQNPNAR